MRPVVGVMPLWDDDKESIWMLPGYMEGIALAGATPVIFPFSTDKQELKQLVDICSGFLFTGGHDVSPELYGEKPLKGLVQSCKKRDIMEKTVLEMAIADDKPVLGICRGIQLINAALGGTLYQDLPAQYPSDINHHQSPPYDIPVHNVIIGSETPLYECLGVDHLSVNSYHHQAIKDLSPELMVMATAPDGIAEAVCRPASRFIWAVQWHPEFSYKTDINSVKIFEAFAEAMN